MKFLFGPTNVATYHKEARVKQHLFIPDHRQRHLLGSRKSITTVLTSCQFLLAAAVFPHSAAGIPPENSASSRTRYNYTNSKNNIPQSVGCICGFEVSVKYKLTYE